jgi:hypothetical protein
LTAAKGKAKDWEAFKLFHEDIEGDVDLLATNLDGIDYMLKPFGSLRIYGEANGSHRGLILIPVENNDGAFLSLPLVHDTEIEAIGGEA